MSSHKFPGYTDNLDIQATGVTQIDLELAIETERILSVINKTICKIEFAVCLPLLLQNDGELLHPHLKEDEMASVFEACFPYINKGDDYHMDNNIHEVESITKQVKIYSPMQGKRMNSYVVEEREDPKIWNAIELLWSKPPIRNMIKELLLEISSAASSFISYLKQLEAFAQKCLSTSPHMERVREESLRRVWHNNENAKAEISLLSSKLEEQNSDIQLKLIAKNLLINQHEAKLERVNKKCKDDIRKRIYDSEKKMVTDWKESEMRQEMLKADVTTQEAKLNSLLNSHLQEERDLRAKRLKVEAQLISWLNKYDADIGDKQAEYDEIMAGFEDEKKQMEELTKQFEIQEEEYERLMKEKADEEQAILEKKMYIFICNRSARRIQRYWRAYRARKLARRKGRRKAKKK